MGLITGVLKAGVAAKAIEVAKREAAKPENRAKAKEMYAKFSESRRARKAR